MSFHPQYGTVCYHYIGNYIPQSLPVEGGWLRPAARERSSHGTDRSHWEAHGLAQTISCPIPLIKVLRSFSKSDRSPRSSKLYPAVSPRRRRMAPSSRSRTIYVGNGRNHIGKHMDLHKLYPYSLFIKVLRSFFKSDRSPRSPASPHPPSSTYFHKKGL